LIISDFASSSLSPLYSQYSIPANFSVATLVDQKQPSAETNNAVLYPCPLLSLGLGFGRYSLQREPAQQQASPSPPAFGEGSAGFAQGKSDSEINAQL
jgi:hypothetical protein